MDEFQLIRQFFDRGTADVGVVVGIGDDGAVLTPDPDLQQVQVIDTLIEGVHFLPGTAPSDIAHRAVAVNLSDIAAMGATPRWMTLALTIRGVDENWLSAFASGLFEAADRFGVTLIGGDTTQGATLTISISVTGEIGPGDSLLRSGAGVGDAIFVTGTVGDAAAGLELLQRGETEDRLTDRFLRPTPRVEVGQQLIGIASAAIDLSDGLSGDLTKLLRASGVGAEIDLENLPLSNALREHFTASEQLEFALSGGDDYELCFTAEENSVAKIRETTAVTKIGTVTDSGNLVCRLRGHVVDVDNRGYRHFA